MLYEKKKKKCYSGCIFKIEVLSKSYHPSLISFVGKGHAGLVEWIIFKNIPVTHKRDIDWISKTLNCSIRCYV